MSTTIGGGAAVLSIACSLRAKLYSIEPWRCCSSVNDTLKSKLKSPLMDDAHGNPQPMRFLYVCSFGSAARDTAMSVTSWFARCTAIGSTPSAIDEHDGQPCV